MTNSAVSDARRTATVPAPGPRASVIVCAYTLDRLDDLLACLEAVRTQPWTPHEIVCVIDHQPELERVLADLGADRGWDDVAIIPNRAERGLSGARNTGVAATSGDIVVFVDDDALPGADWLSGLVAPFGDVNVAGVGGRIDPGWSGDRPWWFPPHLDWTVGCSIPTLPPDGGPIRNMYGASAALRRSALLDVGGFSTSLGRVGADGAGCEETEVCIRIRQADPAAVIVYAPRSTVVHRVTAERASVRYVLRRCRAEGRSKAELARRVGASSATGDERSYVVHIARAVTSDLLAGIRHPQRIGRAAVLVAGLVVASLSYLAERWRPRP